MSTLVFCKTKTDVSKTQKMAAGGLGSTVGLPVGVRGQSLGKFGFFHLKHGKTAIVKMKKGKNISAIVLFNLPLTLLLLNFLLLTLTYSYFRK